MELYEAMRTTFACRDFTDDHLPDEVIHEMIENARFSPSGGQPPGQPGHRRARHGDARAAGRAHGARGQALPRADRRGREPLERLGADQAHARADRGDAGAGHADRAPGQVLGGARGLRRPQGGRRDRPVSRPRGRDRRGLDLPLRLEPAAGGAAERLRQAPSPRSPSPTSPRSRNCSTSRRIMRSAPSCPSGARSSSLTKLKRRPVEEIATRERFDGEAFTQG